MLEPVSTEIEIWLVDDREVVDPALLDQYQQLMNVEETRRHQRFVFTRHRHQFLVARALVRSVLARHLGLKHPGELTFGKNPHGKPCLENGASLQFNLTHTNGLIALAVSPVDNVGIDVEQLSRQADISRLTDRYFSPRESAALYDLPVAEWNNRFFELWTLKEAYLKARGTGLKTPLHDFSFNMLNDGINIEFSSAIEDDPAHWQFWLLNVDGAYRMALAGNNTVGREYLIRARKGIPLQAFHDVMLPVLRQSDRADGRQNNRQDTRQENSLENLQKSR